MSFNVKKEKVNPINKKGIKIKGPVSYYLLQNEDRFIYLFGDYHSIIDDDNQVPTMTAVMEDLFYKTNDKIHVFLEHGEEGDPIPCYLNEMVDYFKDCLQPKGKTQECDRQYPNVRFHYIDGDRDIIIKNNTYRMMYFFQQDKLKYPHIAPLIDYFSSLYTLYSKKLIETGDGLLVYIYESLQLYDMDELKEFLFEMREIINDSNDVMNWAYFDKKMETFDDEYRELLTKTIQRNRLTRVKDSDFFIRFKRIEKSILFMNFILSCMTNLLPEYNTIIRMFGIKYQGEFPKKMVCYEGDFHIQHLIRILLQFGFTLLEKNERYHSKQLSFNEEDAQWIIDNQLEFMTYDDLPETQIVTVHNLTLWETKEDVENDSLEEVYRALEKSKRKKRKNKKSMKK